MSQSLSTRCLIVDDEINIRKLCHSVGSSMGFECIEAESGEAALSLLDSETPHLILADLMMPNMTGLEFLYEVKQKLPRCEVAIMTGHASVTSAVEAMKRGAYDYIQKPFRVEELRAFLHRMEDKVRLVAENQFLRDRVRTQGDWSGIIGSSPRLQDMLHTVARLQDTRTPVLVCGESGTGKELVARAIHYGGPFAERPFVAVDCGSLVSTLIESELFGHEKGAFTGAIRSKEGLFQQAQGGTIFLDEIGELPLDMQAKLLRVLQEKEVRPVGSNEHIKVDVRIIAATNRDLEAAALAGRFRKDLYFRLNVVTIYIPPLRERKTDIPVLLQWFLEKYAPGESITVTDAARQLLLQHDWPGNIRELENCVQRAVALGGNNLIDAPDLPPSLRRGVPSQNLAGETAGPAPSPLPGATTVDNRHHAGQPGELETMAEAGALSDAGALSNDLEQLERETIQRVIDEVRGQKSLAGKMLGISRATLYRKLKRYKIQGAKRLA